MGFSKSGEVGQRWGDSRGTRCQLPPHPCFPLAGQEQFTCPDALRGTLIPATPLPSHHPCSGLYPHLIPSPPGSQEEPAPQFLLGPQRPHGEQAENAWLCSADLPDGAEKPSHSFPAPQASQQQSLCQLKGRSRCGHAPGAWCSLRSLGLNSQEKLPTLCFILIF